MLLSNKKINKNGEDNLTMVFTHICETNPEIDEYMDTQPQPDDMPYKANYKVIFSPEKGDHLIFYGRSIIEEQGIVTILDCWSYGTYYPKITISGVPFISYKLTIEDV